MNIATYSLVAYSNSGKTTFLEKLIPELKKRGLRVAVIKHDGHDFEIDKEGKGVIVYLNQEGRGIGLMNKIAAYKLQEEGYDTVDANIHLGFDPDERDYGVGASILRELGVTKMKLMTNNPVKRIGLESYGLEIVENVPIEVKPNKYNEFYLQTKKIRMGHTLKNTK